MIELQTQVQQNPIPGQTAPEIKSGNMIFNVGDAIVAFWGGGSTDQWSGPTPFPVPVGWSVRATATGGDSGQGLAALLGSGAERRVEVISGPGASARPSCAGPDPSWW